MRLAGLVIGVALVFLAGVMIGLALAPRVSAATLRSATVIPAAPPTSIATRAQSASSAAAEPDQWRTGASPAAQSAFVRVPEKGRGNPPRLDDAVRQARSGIASWFPVPGYVAAVPGWRWGDTPYRLRVCAGSRCVVVTVVDCLCGRSDRVIDLSADAFARLAPLSRGLVRVTMAFP